MSESTFNYQDEEGNVIRYKGISVVIEFLSKAMYLHSLHKREKLCSFCKRHPVAEYSKSLCVGCGNDPQILGC